MGLGFGKQRRGSSFTREELRRRAFLRVARVLYEHWEEGTGAHSRLFETLIPDSYILFGNAIDGDGWREHVVPCSVIRDCAFDLFDKQTSIEEVADFVEEHLKIVLITPEQRRHLDFELGLKNAMPPDWKPGDTLARLQAAGIKLSEESR